jgi:hypothetical protein
MKVKKRNWFLILGIITFIILTEILSCINTGYTYSDSYVFLPEMWIDDNHYLQELNLETGIVTRRRIGIDSKLEYLERNINVGNGKIALVCSVVFPEYHFADREGYVYYYDTNLRELYYLSFFATVADDIVIKQNKNGTYMVVEYYKRPDEKIRVYQLEPFKLLLEQKINRWGELMEVDAQYIYYVDSDEVISIRSIKELKEIKRVRVKPIGTCFDIRNKKALISISDMNYQIIDLWSGESKNFNFKDPGYVDLSEDGQWLMYCGVDKYSFTGKVIVINLSNGQKKEVQIDPKVLRKSEKTTIMRFGKAFFIREKEMTVLDMQSGKITHKKFIFQDDRKKNPLALKAQIDKLIHQYEISLVKAINTNNFSLVAKTLTPGSPLYQSQKQLVTNLYRKRIQEDLNDYQVKKIRMVAPGSYKVYVYERVGIKYPNQKEFVEKEYYWAYTVVGKGDQLTLSDIEKWEDPEEF